MTCERGRATCECGGMTCKRGQRPWQPAGSAARPHLRTSSSGTVSRSRSVPHSTRWRRKLARCRASRPRSARQVSTEKSAPLYPTGPRPLPTHPTGGEGGGVKFALSRTYTCHHAYHTHIHTKSKSMQIRMANKKMSTVWTDVNINRHRSYNQNVYVLDALCACALASIWYPTGFILQIFHVRINDATTEMQHTQQKFGSTNLTPQPNVRENEILSLAEVLWLRSD